jgi:hypothetical protein
MAKKTTRQRKEIAQQRAIQQAIANAGLASTRAEMPAATAPAAPAVRQAAGDVDEFRYVRGDLRRIFILAASIITVLVALSFVIQ